MPKRSFEEMSIVAIGAQTFRDRFGGEHRFSFELDAPPISQWRCNLTALSQEHNLYFVAYGQSIYVYSPQFPSQKIGKFPLLQFTSQPSDCRLHGYIDPRNPHSINDLIVQLLGTEEVVAVVRDDGDVDAFLTRHIVHAIARRQDAESTIGIEGDEIKPFFQRNVGISAWGLAIHSEARILATSANNHEVRVFKFGLLQTSDLESPSDKDENKQPDTTDETSSAQTKAHRKTDVTHHVLNGETNIPCISFCNTGDDPDARWLLTTDISGVCRVMDLHSLEPVQAFRFGPSFATAPAGGFDRHNAGWAIMFLDRRSFLAESDACIALGADERVQNSMPKVHRNGDIWDLSNTVRRLKESSEPFRPHSAQTRQRGDGATATPINSNNLSSFTSPSRELDFEIDTDENAEHDESSDNGGAQLDVEIDERDDPLEDDDDGGGIEVEIFRSTMETDEDEGADPNDDMEHRAAEDEDQDESMLESPLTSDSDSDNRIGDMLVDDADDPDDEGTEDTIPYAAFYNGDSIVGHEPRFVHPTTPLCDSLPCPILHASVRNIFLLQPSKQHQTADASNSEAAFQPPMLGFANPLRQTIHQSFDYLRHFERLNMSASIPSLGIVVLGSQKGRALILSLTKLTPYTHFPDAMNSFTSKDKSVYGMKIEAIVPFGEQERRNERSDLPLHGIAVGPMQGFEGRKSRRWRLMMMYQDHSILSYEISRRSKARDSGVDVGAVVV